MKGTKLHIVLLLWNMSFCTLFAQVNFYAEGAREAFTGQTYVVSYVLENADGTHFRMPKSYPGFQIIGGPNQSSSYQWVNGKSTKSVSYSYYLQPIKEGNFVIPKASVTVDGKALTTEEIEVTIKKGSAQQNARQPKNKKSNNGLGQQENGDWKEQLTKNLFVKMSVDKSSPYVGEQVNLTLKLYQRIQTYQMHVTEMPEFEGLWKHDYEIQNSDWKKEEIDGVWYNTLLINKYALFAQREGKFTISPLKLETIVRLRTSGNTGNSLLDQFFGSYENKIYPFQSNSVVINAKALPLANKPINFSGAVGSFKYKASLDSLSVHTGNAVELKTSITGTGNIMMIDAPELSMDDMFEVYDPESKEYISKKSNKINGTKKYNYQIIAKIPGQYKLEPLSFSFFDLKSKDYKTVYSDTLVLEVKPSAAYLEALKQAKEEERLENLDDLLPIALDNDLHQKNDFVVESTMYKLLGVAPFFLLLFVFVVKKQRDNHRPDLIALNRKKATKVALKKLKQASLFLKDKNQKSFYNEVIRSLWDYVSLKLDIDPENLSKDNIKENLLHQNVSEYTVEEYIKLIENCEKAIYTPIKSMQMQSDFNSAKEIIIALENVL